MSRAAWEKRSQQWRWPYLRDLARRADDLGLDYLFIAMAYPPPGGFGADLRFREFRMESLATAAAITAVTRRIFVCPTVHILYQLAPVFLAQWGTTVDHVGEGRVGFNLVAGMSVADMELLGARQLAHDERYHAAAEFTEVMTRAWTEGRPFDHSGRFYQSRGAWVSPKPVQRPYPLLINAGLSPAGRDFAARFCDWSFINPPSVTDLEQARPLCEDLKCRAAGYGRRLRLLTQALVFCRESDDEAEGYYRWVVENAADDAVEAWQAASRRAAQAGISRDTSRFASDRARGEGRVFVSGVPVVGSPRRVVEHLQALQRVGLDGVHLGFLDYDDLDVVGQRVLPLLREAGLR